MMNPHIVDINMTLMNNTLHAPWIGQPELKKAWIMIDDFLLIVRDDKPFVQDCSRMSNVSNKRKDQSDKASYNIFLCMLH